MEKQAHVTRNINDWTPVLFTDEYRFSVDFMDTRVRVLDNAKRTLSSGMQLRT